MMMYCNDGSIDDDYSAHDEDDDDYHDDVLIICHYRSSKISTIR